MNPRSLRGKAVVITGAASGIGEALALACAARGARLLLADINTAGLERVQRAVQAAGGECHTCTTDTGDENAIKLLAARAMQARAAATNLPSPCISVCSMDPVSALCAGCLRTLDEIRQWSSADDAAKRVMWQCIETRLSEKQA